MDLYEGCPHDFLYLAYKMGLISIAVPYSGLSISPYDLNRVMWESEKEAGDAQGVGKGSLEASTFGFLG